MIRDLSFSPIMIMSHNREYNFVHIFIYVYLYTYIYIMYIDMYIKYIYNVYTSTYK